MVRLALHHLSRLRHVLLFRISDSLRAIRERELCNLVAGQARATGMEQKDHRAKDAGGVSSGIRSRPLPTASEFFRAACRANFEGSVARGLAFLQTLSGCIFVTAEFL